MMVMGLYGRKHLNLSHHPAKFGDVRRWWRYDSEDMIFLFVTWSWKTTWLKGHVILGIRVSHGKSPFCQVRWPLTLLYCRYNVFNLSRDLTRPRFERFTWFYWWEALMVSQHLDICGGHWSSANGDVKYLTRHVTSQDYEIGGSCDFMGGSSALYVTKLPSLVATSIAVVEIKCVQFVKWSRKTTWPTGHVSLWMGPLSGKSPPCQV